MFILRRMLVERGKGIVYNNLPCDSDLYSVCILTIGTDELDICNSSGNISGNFKED